MKYRGEHSTMWDAWFLKVGSSIHAFHLQFPETTPEGQEMEWTVGHIKTDDLIHWYHVGEILPPLYGEDERDYRSKFTGCAYTMPPKDGEAERYLVYYTMRDKAKGSQRLGVAISRDLEHFEPYADNPILVPDPATFISYDNIKDCDWDIVDCRDLLVLKHDDGLYYGYFATAADVGREHPVGVIAVAVSDDLINWRDQSIVFVPRQNGAIEVPDVYCIDGKWYLTMLCGTGYNGRSSTSDDYVLNCTTYAVADNPRGPFVEGADNILIGGITQSGYTCRTVAYGDKRYLYYIDRSEGGGTLSLPKEIRVVDGKLGAYYASILESLRVRTLIDGSHLPTAPVLVKNSFAWHTFGGKFDRQGNGYVGETQAFDYQSAFFEARCPSLEMVADITVDAVGAGFAVQTYGKDGKPHSAYVLSIEPDKSRLLLMRNVTFEVISGREFPFERGRTYQVRLLMLEGNCEVYIDGKLLLQNGVDTGETLSPGLFCDRGKVRFDNLTVYALEK